MAEHLFHFLIFPGFVFTAVVGLLSSWVDRKVTARVQWRVGPPLFQPFYDLCKLVGKEVIIPAGGRGTGFLLIPLIGLAGVTLASTVLCLANWGKTVFVGDLIAVIYLLTLPSLAVILGGIASGNPISGMGASREAKLLLSYELPLVLCIAVVVTKAGYTLSLAEITDTIPFYSISGVIALVISLLCVQAKLAFVPFDIPEAETEIIAGPYLEYSGAPLAVFKLTQAMMLFTLPVYLVTLFWGGGYFAGPGILWGILKYVVLIVLIVLIKNTNPRVRIDQAMGFLWKYATPLALLSLILAAIGRSYGILWL